jgi:diaminopimelate epimerase
LPFVKMNGLGNDFIVADLRHHSAWSELLADPSVVQKLCDRHRGIGADGVLAILGPQSPGAVATMRVHNSDGSLAEMCGNGLRCVARFLIEHEPIPDFAAGLLTIDTGAGALRCELTRSSSGGVSAIGIDMGKPVIPTPGMVTLELKQVPERLELALVSMGNPHAVWFCDTASSYESLRATAERVGPLVECHPCFPQRTNVEFVRVVTQPDRSPYLEVVVWERGCGVTQACGTGACAAAVAACRRGALPFGQRCVVRLPGGELDITVAADASAVLMRGPAETVFFGEIETSTIMALDGAAQ